MERESDDSEGKKQIDDSNFLSGILADIDDLLKKFEATNSIRFEDFAKLWVEKKFSFIFWGQKNFSDKLEVTEDILRIAVTFTQPLHSIPVRFGGLYLVYSLYLKQLMTPKVRIRVTMTQWQGLQDLLCLAIQQGHHEFIYMLRWLHLNHAFDFVAFEKMYMYPWNMQRKKYDADYQAELKLEQRCQPLSNYIDEGHMEMLSTIHKKYEKVKMQLQKKNLIDSKSAVSLGNSSKNVGNEITEQLDDFISQRKIKKSTTDDASTDEAVAPTEDNIAASRSAIKKAQYSRPVPVVQSRRSKRLSS